MNTRKWLPLLALGTLMLSSCEISFAISLPFGTSNAETTSQVSYTPISSATSVEPGQGYYRPSSYSITQSQYNDGAGLFTLRASGNQKVLVIPVAFSDYPCSGGACTARLADLDDAFFGAATDTSWESVASFYERSSYGQLTLDGIVTPVYNSSMTSATFASNVRTTGEYYEYYDPTWIIVEEAVAWYKALSGSNLDDYDNDNDGFIDTVWLVYNNPNSSNATYTTDGEEVFWAYTYWDYDNWSLGSVASPVPMTYAWASYDFMYEGYGSLGIDAHTYIHETGHALGLDDYYSYTEDDWGAAGGVDMMDFNIVDHNAYSKLFLGWADPYVIDGTLDTTTITLNPFESSGDFILINNAWNGSSFDEYLLLEFYTPTGLNYKDSLDGGYPGNNLRGFYEPGIKIYHVDARLGEYDYGGEFLGYVDTVATGSESYAYLAHSNSLDYSQDPDYRLLHLLEEGGVNTFKDNGDVATNATLFQQGDEFTAAAYATFFASPGGRFNDNALIGYSIEVTSMSSTSTTLTITKI